MKGAELKDCELSFMSEHQEFTLELLHPPMGPDGQLRGSFWSLEVVACARPRPKLLSQSSQVAESGQLTRPDRKSVGFVFEARHCGAPDRNQIG